MDDRSARATLSKRESARVHQARRKKKQRLILVVIVVAVTAGAFTAFALTGGSERTPGGVVSEASNGQPKPVSFTSWDGKEVVSTERFRGKPLVVNFWATWCTACLFEIPSFVSLYESYDGKVAFLGLNLQDNPEAAAAMKGELGITYPTGRDPKGEAFSAFGGVAMPTTVLIAPDGEVVERLDGEVSADQLASKLEEYFGVEA